MSPKIVEYVFIFLVTFIHICNGFLTVSLKPFDPNDGNTKCKGFLLNTDYIVIHGTVALTNQSLNISIQEMEAKIIIKNEKENTSVTVGFLLFSECKTTNTTTKFYCSIRNNTIETVLNSTFSEESSEYSVIMHVTVNKIKYSSNATQLPKIFNFHQMTLNNQEISDGTSSLILNDKEDSIKLCCKEARTICTAVISINESYQVNGSGCAVYKVESKEKRNYTFGYKVCEYIQRYNLTLEFDYFTTQDIAYTSSPSTDTTPEIQSASDENETNIGLIVGLSVGLLVGAAFVISLICGGKYYYRRRRANLRNRSSGINTVPPVNYTSVPTSDMPPERQPSIELQDQRTEGAL